MLLLSCLRQIVNTSWFLGDHSRSFSKVVLRQHHRPSTYCSVRVDAFVNLGKVEAVGLLARHQWWADHALDMLGNFYSCVGHYGVDVCAHLLLLCTHQQMCLCANHTSPHDFYTGKSFSNGLTTMYLLIETIFISLFHSLISFPN